MGNESRKTIDLSKQECKDLIIILNSHREYLSKWKYCKGYITTNQLLKKIIAQTSEVRAYE